MRTTRTRTCKRITSSSSKFEHTRANAHIRAHCKHTQTLHHTLSRSHHTRMHSLFHKRWAHQEGCQKHTTMWRAHKRIHKSYKHIQANKHTKTTITQTHTSKQTHKDNYHTNTITQTLSRNTHYHTNLTNTNKQVYTHISWDIPCQRLAYQEGGRECTPPCAGRVASLAFASAEKKKKKIPMSNLISIELS